MGMDVYIEDSCLLQYTDYCNLFRTRRRAMLAKEALLEKELLVDWLGETKVFVGPPELNRERLLAWGRELWKEQHGGAGDGKRKKKNAKKKGDGLARQNALEALKTIDTAEAFREWFGNIFLASLDWEYLVLECYDHVSYSECDIDEDAAEYRLLVAIGVAAKAVEVELPEFEVSVFVHTGFSGREADSYVPYVTFPWGDCFEVRLTPLGKRLSKEFQAELLGVTWGIYC